MRSVMKQTVLVKVLIKVLFEVGGWQSKKG